jgi:hypothetical protein
MPVSERRIRKKIPFKKGDFVYKKECWGENRGKTRYDYIYYIKSIGEVRANLVGNKSDEIIKKYPLTPEELKELETRWASSWHLNKIPEGTEKNSDLSNYFPWNWNQVFTPACLNGWDN